MKIQMLLCSKDVVIDQATNMVSVFNIYEDVVSPAYPLYVSPFTVFMVATREDSDPDSFQTSLALKLDNDSLFNNPWPIEFRGTKRVRNAVQFTMVPVARPGNLVVSLSMGNEILNSYIIPFTISGPIQAKPKEQSTATDTITTNVEVKSAPDISGVSS